MFLEDICFGWVFFCAMLFMSFWVFFSFFSFWLLDWLLWNRLHFDILFRKILLFHSIGAVYIDDFLFDFFLSFFMFTRRWQGIIVRGVGKGRKEGVWIRVKNWRSWVGVMIVKGVWAGMGSIRIEMSSCGFFGEVRIYF